MKWITDKLIWLTGKERSLERLTLSFCIGNYIAFSPFPFPFGHTILVFALSWLLSLNTGVVLFVAFLINNPWTAIPVYGLDYGFGYWLIHSLFGNVIHFTNPAWMQSINMFLYAKLGIPDFCFWSFMIGGNLLGIITSVMLYPVMKRIFAKILLQTNIA